MTQVTIQQSVRAQEQHMLAAAIVRVLHAFVSFWNIPVLGGDETPESRYFRTRRRQ